MDIPESLEYVPKNRSRLCTGERSTLEEGGQGQGHVGEDEGEAVLVVSEGLKERDTWFLQLGENLGFPDGIVRLDAVSLCDDFEGTVFVPVDLGRDAAGDVLTASVWAYPLPGSSISISIVIAVFGGGVRRI